MKKLLFIVFVLITFIACEDKKSDKQQDVITDEKKEQANVSPKITVTTNDTQIEKDNPFVSYDIDGNKVVKISPDGEETPLTKELGGTLGRVSEKVPGVRYRRNAFP